MFRNESLIEILLLLVLAGTRLTSCLPQPDGKVPTSDNADSIIDLPFLQLKNGGIRVNFAGYHAEAGLGGLLGGPNTKGGLYASAGTPWGPSASAGLGGNVGGADGGNTGGGLHARAGLGNGGPEAAAGLGGNLDGSGRSGSRARGGLYAGATAGGRPLTGIVIGDPASAGIGAPVNRFDNGDPGQGQQNFDSAEKSPKDRGHIQAIARPATGEKVYLAKAGVKEPATTLEFKLPATNQRASNLVEETPKLENPGPSAPASDVYEVPQITHANRRYYRKLLRGNAARKNGFYKYLTGSVPVEPAVQSTSPEHAVPIVARQIVENEQPVARADVPYGVAGHPRNPTLFDNIFNIPISTLAAVNQLLNSKYG